jgi:hypothetical protein
MAGSGRTGTSDGGYLSIKFQPQHMGQPLGGGEADVPLSKYQANVFDGLRRILGDFEWIL